jgi:tetratricopeptide (TPR) repeat protein
VDDVEAVRALLGDVFETVVLSNPEEPTVRMCLRKLAGSQAGRALVVMWSGHGLRSAADNLRLLARDSVLLSSSGIGISDLAGASADSGANQVLFIIDTCFAGTAVAGGEVAASIMRASPPLGEHVWVGVLASCLDAETARDGLFGQRLQEVLENGPQTPELKVRWSSHNQYVRGDDVCDAVLKEWGSDLQSPDFAARGSAWWMFRNPIYAAGAPEQVVEHLLQAARSGARLDERSWFTGRTEEINQVAGWVRSGRAGIYVLSGSAGTGKSAIAGRIVSLSNPDERERLLRDGRHWAHQDPGERSVHAHLHARGLTADRAAAVLAEQLVARKVLPPQAEPQNASELVGQVQRAVEGGAASLVFVVDGLDEAREEAFTIAQELLIRLARHAVVVVSTRELRRGRNQPSLLEILVPSGPRLDLDEPAVQERTRACIADYITERLETVDPGMDAHAVARYLTGETSMTEGCPFLLARLVTDQLRASPVGTTAEGWSEAISKSVEEALNADLARTEPPPGRPQDDDGREGLARVLLAALTWGYGAGFPEDEWLATTNALTSDDRVGRDDVLWILGQLGRYIVQDGDAGVAVYRVAHQSLTEHLRPPFHARHDQPFNPQALEVLQVLAARYQRLLDGGVKSYEPAYLWRYIWRHAADAGPEGLAVLRRLAEQKRALRYGLAMAAQRVARSVRDWGRPLDAVPLEEEAAEIFRDFTDGNSALRGHLGGTLLNLGNYYNETGRYHDALLVTEEAVRLLSGLADEDPAVLPDLAMALNNLGGSYMQVGRPREALAAGEEAVRIYQGIASSDPSCLPGLALALTCLVAFSGELGSHREALAAGEEAVRIYRGLAKTRPSYLPDLATALNNAGTAYAHVGRSQDALAAAEEAVQLRRDMARDNPAFIPGLATALSNLSMAYVVAARAEDALATAEEAVHIYRGLGDNPAFLPGLAIALNNLAIRYSEAGRLVEAVRPTEDAVQIYRGLVQDNPAFLPDLARALNNLSVRYSEAGQPMDAPAPADEAARLYAELATRNPALLRGLATALTNLGTSYSDVGRAHDAVRPTEDAVRLYRQLAKENPVLLSELAGALSNLGMRYRATGRTQAALAAAEEAAQIYRDLTDGYPLFRPGLAGALTNLGLLYGALGRDQEARAVADQATEIYRDLADGNPAFLPDLATALANSSMLHSVGAGHSPQALADTEESAELYRRLADGNPAFLPGLAGALNNLSSEYARAGSIERALELNNESVGIYRGLAAGNPAFVPYLALALTGLGAHLADAGLPEGGEAAWREALAELDPVGRADLLTARAEFADAGDPDAARWLAEGLRVGSGAPRLAARIHDQARRHWAADNAAFLSAWEQSAGEPAPAWLTVPAGLLATARAWVATRTYDQERDFLARHPELLDPAADEAVAEALVPESAEAASRHETLRQAARINGVEAAYRPLLRTLLARQFTEADLDGQRSLLASRRDELLSATVRDAVDSLAQAGDQTAVRASVLLDLAAQGEDASAMDALADTTLFPALLHELACRPDSSALHAVVRVALTVPGTAEQVATVLFYFAVAASIAGNAEEAIEVLAKARQLGSGQEAAWITWLADIGRHHPPVLPLIPGLTSPLADPDHDEDEAAAAGNRGEAR